MMIKATYNNVCTGKLYTLSLNDRKQLLYRKGQVIIATVTALITSLLVTSMLASQAEYTDIEKLVSLINNNQFSQVEEAIMNNLTFIDEDKTVMTDKNEELVKLHYILSLCYYWDEEDKVIDNLDKVLHYLSHIEETELKTETASFLSRFSMFYDNHLKYAPYHCYYLERKEYYIRIFQQRADIATALQSIHLARRWKRELIRFEDNILKKDRDNEQIRSIHASFDSLLRKMERIPQSQEQ